MAKDFRSANTGRAFRETIAEATAEIDPAEAHAEQPTAHDAQEVHDTPVIPDVKTHDTPVIHGVNLRAEDPQDRPGPTDPPADDGGLMVPGRYGLLRRYVPQKTVDEREAMLRAAIGNTQGRKGAQMPRMNIAFRSAVYDYIRTMAQAQGLSMTDFVNRIATEHMQQHQAEYDQALELRLALINKQRAEAQILRQYELEQELAEVKAEEKAKAKAEAEQAKKVTE